MADELEVAMLHLLASVVFAVATIGLPVAVADPGSAPSVAVADPGSTASVALAADLDRVFTLPTAGDWPGWATLGPSPGTTRFVSPSGSDATGLGSAARPFRSIQRAIDVSAPGDEVRIAAGEYPGEVRIRQPNLTLRGTLGAGKPHLVVPNQSETSNEIALEIDPDADGTRIIGLEVEGGSYYALSCETKWDWGDPSDRSGATRVVIAYNDLHHSGRDAVKIKPNCDDVLLANNTIHHTGQRDDSNAEGIDNVNGDRLTVLDNHLFDVATTGLYFKGGASDVRVERNLIERVGSGVSPDSVGAGILVGFDTDTDYFDRVQNPGMYEALRGRVVNNIIDGTTMSGIGIYAAKDSLVAHNTIRNCCRDYHAGIYFGISLQSWMADGLRPASRNVTVWGNLVGVSSANGRDYGSAIRYLHEPELGPVSGYQGMPSMDYNVYAAATEPLRFGDSRPASPYDGAGLPGWAAHVGAEGHSLARAFSLDALWSPTPQVAVAPSGRYSLPTDFYRRARTPGPTAGAVEGAGAPTSKPPGAPGAFAAIPGDGTASFTWTPSMVDPSDSVASYEVVEVAGPGRCSVSPAAVPLGCTIRGLTNAGRYTFAVSAVSAKGYAPSGVATVSVTPNGLPPSPPRPTLRAADRSLVATWAPVPFRHGGTLTRYTVTARPGGAVCTAAGNSPAPTCVLRGLTNGATYSVAVTATSAADKTSVPSPSATAFPHPPSAIWQKWAQLGGAIGPLGRPLGLEAAGPLGSRLQRFARGGIYWSRATGAHEVYGAIGARYAALAPLQRWRLGLPTSGEYAVPGGRANNFQRGRIIWIASGGTTVR